MLPLAPIGGLEPASASNNSSNHIQSVASPLQMLSMGFLQDGHVRLKI